jgi:transposase-like protein
LRCMLRYRTIAGIRLHIQFSEKKIIAMYGCVRNIMTKDVPRTFSGVVEVDETYIGAQWRNRKWSVRKLGTKKGRGTFKLAVFGIYERKRSMVRAFIVPDVKKKTLMSIMKKHIKKGSTIYSDAYQLYRETVKEGYVHDFVDHKQGEYGKGPVNSNGMEGFWGVLKRRLKTTGGIRENRLHLYLAEDVWRYNNRKLTEEQKIERILSKLGG